MNPLSLRGHLSYAAFVMTVLMAVAVNILVFVVMRKELIAARAALEQDHVITLYVVWFVFFVFGFLTVSNSFIKRWSTILELERPSKLLKALIRLSLLSPVLSYSLTALTVLYPARDFAFSNPGGSRRFIGLVFLFGTLVFSVIAARELDAGIFGVERVDFKESMKDHVSSLASDPDMTSKKPSTDWPEKWESQTFLAVASPTLRYLTWLLADYLRAYSISVNVSTQPAVHCKERLGFLSVPVDDCFFWNLRNTSKVTPYISPFVGLFFEARYRQAVQKATSGLEGVAISLLTLSNLLELLEQGPMFVERRHLLQPKYLLLAYGNPEVVLVEFGQDAQRWVLMKRLGPIFDLQISAAQTYLESSRQSLGAAATDVEKELRDLKVRVDAWKRQPL